MQRGRLLADLCFHFGRMKVGPYRSRDRWLMLVAMLTLATSMAQAQLTLTLSGTGDWSTASIWSPQNVPGSADSVQISSGTVTVSDSRAVNLLTLSGGTLNGSGTLDVAGLLTWSGTTINGTGVLNANGGLSLTSSVSLYNAQTLNLSGTSTWSGGILYHGDNPILNNAGTLTLTSDVSTSYYFGGGAPLVINNNGTFAKNGTSGTSYIDATFNNTGNVTVQTGTLNLSAGGSNSGTVSVSPSATLALSGGTFTFSPGSAFTGAGTIQVNGATATFAGATTGTGNLTLSSGTLNGTGSVNGLLSVSGGTINGAGTLDANGGVAITGSFDLYGSRTLNLSGLSTWSGGILYHGDNPILNNAGTLTLTSDVSTSYYFGGGAPLVINNSGTFAKNGTSGTSYIDATFNNTSTGNVMGSSGTLSFTNTFTNNGGSILVAGGNLSFTNSLNVGTGTLGGSGTITAPTVTAGGIVLPGSPLGRLNISGNLTLQSTAMLLFHSVAPHKAALTIF